MGTSEEVEEVEGVEEKRGGGGGEEENGEGKPTVVMVPKIMAMASSD